ncbi:hypothetical protein MPSEU_001019600 [Mayamaea pseudoterrestris]|nr:hypothetical protein MPSEU_001019600 [Mayamaea pseudoterrestris]
MGAKQASSVDQWTRNDLNARNKSNSTESPTAATEVSAPSSSTTASQEAASSITTDVSTAPTISPTSYPTAYINPDAPLLPLGDINVVVLTDVHSWLAGHGDKEATFDADYGNVLSFVQRLKAYFLQHEPTKDFWFVMNGDWIDGTGLAMNGDPSHLIPLIEKMPFDAYNVGNHELYDKSVIEYATRPGGFVEWWGDRYLSSNVVLNKSKDEPLGNRYKVLRGKQSNVLTFGFLFNMKGNSNLVTVQEVGNVVREKWFTNALQNEDYDAILVLAHMGVRDPLVKVILTEIRNIVGDKIPVQFLTGHTHYRDFAIVDSASTSVEAGRYFDTVGFVSFPTAGTLKSFHQQGHANATDLFHHVFLDANVDNLQKTLRVDELDTPDGAALSVFIERTRDELGLLESVGCLNDDLFLNNGLDKVDSLWRYFRDVVVPGAFGESDIVFMGKGMWRYDLLSGTILLDDLLSVSPFNESYHLWSDVPGHVIYNLNLTANNNSRVDPFTPPFMPELPEFILCSAAAFYKDAGPYNLVTNAFESKQVEKLLDMVDPDFADRQPIVLNFTTTDLWIAHFRQERHLFGCSSKGNVHGKNSHGSSIYGSALEHERDMMWMLFLLLAVACVLVLSVWRIRQRALIHRRVTYQRDFATDEARREYEESQGECYRDGDESEDDDELI